MNRRLAVTAAGLSLSLLAPTIAVATAGRAGADTPGTAYTWIGRSQDGSADGHSWTDARNWSPQGVPGDGDAVTITSPAGADCHANVDGTPAVALSSLTIAPLHDSFGDACSTSVAGAAVSVSGTFAWHGGTISTPLTLDAGSTASISAPVSAPRLHADLHLGGTLELDGLTGADALEIAAPATVTVDAAGTLRSAGANAVTYTGCCTHPARIVNAGTLDVEGGTLAVAGVELDQKHVLNVGTGALLDSTLAPVTAGPDAGYTGAGTWRIRSNAIARLSGTQTLGPDFHLALGGGSTDPGVRLGGAFTLAGTGTLDWDGGTIEAAMTVGAGVLVHAAGPVTGNGARLLRGHDYTAGGKGVAVTLTNYGRFVVDGGAGFRTAEQARIANASGATLQLDPGTNVTAQACCVDPDRITNAGRVLVPATAPGAAVLAGLSYRSTGGTTSIAAGRELRVTASAPAALASSTVSGGGTLTLAVPTTFASGTSRSHDAIAVGRDTRLVLTRTTTVGRYVDITSTGTLDNRGTLDLSPGADSVLTISGTYLQRAGATTVLDVGRSGSDTVRVGSSGTLGGRLVVRDAAHWYPATGARRTAVTARGGLHSTPAVHTVHGTGATRARHWVASRSATTLTLIARAG